MNAGDEDSDDGLVLAGEANPGSAYNQMMMPDSNLDMNFQKIPSPKHFSGWIQWFISLEDHEFLIEVDKDFISDKMNLLGLRENFATKDRFKECLRLLLSNKVPNEEDL